MTITGGVIATSAEPNVVTSWDGSSSPIAITAGTGIDIAGGVISSTASGGGNFTLGTTVTATTNFPKDVYTPVWTSLSGTNIVGPNELQIGETVEVDIVGFVIQEVLGQPNADTGSNFRFNFGSAIVNAVSTNISLISVGAGNTGFSLKIKITRVGATDVVASAAGYYLNNSNVVTSIYFPSFIPATTFAYNQASSYAITLEFLNGNSYANGVGFVCQNLNIIQYA
jgi:hypothetical protein